MVPANGARFHVAEAGRGPLVMLLHGFPQFWWMWRFQLTALADAGYRAVAMDLRGYGASDKPPRGYDLPTLAADVHGVMRSLGESRAVVVGHDWGGMVGWTLATTSPQAVRGLCAISAPHPRGMRRALATNPSQLLASAYALAFQVPIAPERRLIDDDGALVARLLRLGSASEWPGEEEERRYRQAIRVPGVAHSALEMYRWAGRALSVPRPDGLRYLRSMRRRVSVPVLHMHGALDRAVLTSTEQGSRRYVDGPYQWRQVRDVGHFVPEERPEAVTADLLPWLQGLDRSVADSEPADMPEL